MRGLRLPFVLTASAALLWASPGPGAGIVVDHDDTDITALSETALSNAKARLHIAYGHTSHGSQLATGMTGLVGFADAGGLGLSLPAGFFAWNDGGLGGALDLMEGDGYGSGPLDQDCGYYPNWVNETREYLDDPVNSDVNVIIWSWCGQASWYTQQDMIDDYLAPMNQLEIDYRDVHFVYMTGHLDGGSLTENLHLRNQQIRDYCGANGKTLYDFADIESYDPEGNYYGDKLANDNCDYDSDGDGSRDRNWAVDWQNAHVEGVDWYSCTPAHTQPLNGNRKAYAAWALWAEIAALLDEPIPGDTDRDGNVDCRDYLTLKGHLGTPGGAEWRHGDFDGDGDVDRADFLALQEGFSGSSGGSSPVPEPTALSLLALGSLAAMKRKRRRRARAD